MNYASHRINVILGTALSVALVTLTTSTLLAGSGNKSPRKASRNADQVSRANTVDGVDGHRTSFYDPFVAAAQKPAEPTYTTEHGLGAIQIPTLVIPEPLDVEMWKVEDELANAGRMRISGLVDADLNTNDFAPWITIPETGQQIGRVVLTGDAYSLRVILSNMQLPDGASLVMYPLGDESAITGPFTGMGHREDGTSYSRTSHQVDEAQQPSMVLEVRWPADQPLPNNIPFTTEVAWGYHPTFRNASLGGGAGACHNVPACYSDWDDIADSVAHIYYVDGSWGYVCSGQLVATVAADDTPYFLTANHCVNSSAIAASTEFYWRWEKANCSSSSPSFNSTSLTGSLLFANGSADESLLMVLGEMPSYTFFSGWLSGATSSSTSSTCIHHPSGDYKRISFGNKTNSPNCGGSSSYYFRLNWTDGVTEGGSSGSGIWRNSDQRLYGTLTCGASACSGSSGNGGADSYGRFDRLYAGSSSSFAAGSDDSFETNDSCATAADLGSDTYSDLVAKSGNSDWYRLEATDGTTVSVQINFVDSYGDIDAYVYDSCGGSVVDSSTTNSNNESLIWANNTGSTQYYYLHVYLDNDHRNEYDLIVSGSSVPVCGNGVVEAGEECDDGNNNSDDGCFGCEIEEACHSDCAFPYDGFVDTTDFSTMLIEWGGSGGCDINFDGTVNIGDFSQMLIDWGECP